MIILKWNPIRWGGWVCTVVAAVIFLNTGLYSLNDFSGPLSEDIRLKETDYTITELESATLYYRDQANALSKEVKRDANGNVQFRDFDILAENACKGFDILTYEYHYPVFAGSKMPVKKLGWADMYTSMGITGFTCGITGEAAVNPQIPDVTLPFTMCHEMAHRMCIASEKDANFAAFLACSVHEDVQFRYSAYYMAYRYCYSALATAQSTSAAAAAARIDSEVSDLLRRDLKYYDQFLNTKKDDKATKVADTVNDTYLKTSGESAGIASYGQVADLLVNWHIQQVVLPELTITIAPFDPYDETQVDLGGIVNAGGNG